MITVATMKYGVEVNLDAEQPWSGYSSFGDWYDAVSAGNDGQGSDFDFTLDSQDEKSEGPYKSIFIDIRKFGIPEGSKGTASNKEVNVNQYEVDAFVSDLEMLGIEYINEPAWHFGFEYIEA